MHLLSTSTLPVKQRQIAIMRTAWLCDAAYMWSSHLNTSMLFGLDPAMFGPIQNGAEDPYFSDFEGVVVAATDELVTRHEVGEASWNLLMAEWDNQQMLDFLFTVGAYVLTAGVMRSTGVERDQHLLTLAARYGAPGRERDSAGSTVERRGTT
jgi:alkylhydroperoxidase family enzyme